MARRDKIVAQFQNSSLKKVRRKYSANPFTEHAFTQ